MIISTNLGEVKGYMRKGVTKFKGIPYAAPPVGELRFCPPEAREPWSGVLDATEFGPTAPQLPSVLSAMFGQKYKQSEAECLNLNVWTPGGDQAKRPVMVWIHGGGFVQGSGIDLDGARLALRGNVVIVSINYRLGPLGFFYIPEITANVGLLDQIAALKWVKENIEAFGGDPNNVTIFGESAGSMSVCTIMAMPASKDLFKRAIAQSGAVSPRAIHFSEESKEETSRQIMTKIGIKEGDIDALREVPIEKLLKADPSHEAVQKGTFMSSENLMLRPVVDKNTIPENPLDAFRKGFAANVELLIGTNQDETKLWNALNPKLSKIDDKTMRERIYAFISYLGQEKSIAEQLVDTYKKAREGTLSTTPRDVMDAVVTDFIFRVPAIRLAEIQSSHQPNTYMYLFTWKAPMFGGRLGAAHALELPFVFDLLLDSEIGFFPRRNEETEAISHKMMDSWIAFARTGNPNHEGIPRWDPYDTKNRTTMVMDTQFKVVNAPFDAERRAWDQIF